MNRVLVVDDDDTVRLAISENLKDCGFVPIEASSGREALDKFQTEKPVSVLLDLKMPGMDGLTVLRELKKINTDVPVIINTAHGDIQTAVNAIKLGAYDFIIKPPDFDRLVLTLRRAAEKFELDTKVRILDSELETSLEYMLGHGEAIKKVINQIRQVAYSDFSLILQGETGTGKSFIARNIHSLSKRAKGPFINIDIGSIPETLIESELFGFQKGSFTGAEKSKKGFFEIASGGTLLIDELQNLSPYVQGKLLMAVEEKRIYPIGSSQPVKIDVRIIGATNEDIRHSVTENKKFREDLFYRLSEFMITLPPLRERTEDIPYLAEKFLGEAAEDLNRHPAGISEEALDRLKKYEWPGNIRELKNLLRRAALVADGKTINTEHLKFLSSNSTMINDGHISVPSEESTGLSLTEVEISAIKKAMQMTNGNKSKAAQILQVDYTTLLRKIKKYGI